MSDKKLLNYKPFWPETAVIWGAGASIPMGLPGTAEIGRIISILCGIDSEKTVNENDPLDKRIKAAFENKKIHPELIKSFKDLLLLLLDGDGAENPSKALINHKKHVKRIAKNHAAKFGLAKEHYVILEHDFLNLHTIYDWVGVRSIIKYIARRWDYKKKIRSEIILTDLLTTVDQLYEADLAIPTEELFHEKGEEADWIYMIDKHRLLGVKRCLSHLISTIQRICIQEKPGLFSKQKLRPYWSIAQNLAELMEEESHIFHKRRYRTDDRKFYYYSYAFISFNWDPVMTWLIFNAHKKINDKKIKISNNMLRLFHDSGDGIGIRKIWDEKDTKSNDLLAFMMNESTCKRINDPNYQGGEKSRLVRVGKMLFPHAGLGWRICPRCGKLFTDFGESLENLYSTVAFGPDLFPELNKAWKSRTKEEDQRLKYGEYGIIQCIFCGSATRPHDSPLILQSIIKSERHYVMEGIFRELGLVVGNAKHLVFAGYSLPSDDYIYRCFFQSSWAGKKSKEKGPYCSLVNLDPDYSDIMKPKVWLKNDDILLYLNSKKGKPETKETIQNLLELFDIDNVRVSLMGIPGTVTEHPEKNIKNALIDLLYPIRCFPEGFPPKR